MTPRSHTARAPEVGEQPPPLELMALDGSGFRLEDERGRAVLLTFLRHAGWLFCRAHLVKVLRYRDRIDAAGTAVFVVHDEPERVRDWMLKDLEVPYPMLVDLEMDTYREWGLDHTPAAFTLHPRVILGYTRKVLFEGEKLHLGTDPLQLGGDFVVGPDGRLAYSHPQKAVDDRPPAGLLLRELERAAG